jgi:aerobic carbon-monoxide dehydrogenase large subunit
VSFLTSRSQTAREGIGKHVLRKEDARLVTGAGCYSDDVNADGQLHVCFVRSPHAHARIGRIDTAAALAVPGVVAVLTGADLAADGVKPVGHSPLTANPYEDIVKREHIVFVAPHPAMSSDRRATSARSSRWSSRRLRRRRATAPTRSRWSGGRSPR